MFIDTRNLDEDSVVEKEICVIGAGVAGITLALEFEKQGLDACVLESGGYTADERTKDLYRGTSTGLPYQFADGCRSRYLGGSSNCWGGWNRPFEEIDFTTRHWIPDSGWPFGKEELEPYYACAHSLLQLGPNNWDVAFWEKSINKHDVRRVPLATGKVKDIVFQFSPPTRMGTVYRNNLEGARHVSVYLYANVINIETDNDAKTVQRVKVRTLSGRTIWIKAKLFVLATGGIENARLLLASNKTQPAGLGNGNDLVGRYFMDHPRLLSGSIRLAKPWKSNMLYDTRFHTFNPAVSANGVMFGGHFVLAPETQEQERVLNSQTWFRAMFPGEGTEAMRALLRLKLATMKLDQANFKLGRDLLTLLTHPVDAAGFALTRRLHITSWITDVTFQTVVEPAPDPNSRVTLSDECDDLGIPRAKVAWKLGSLVRRTFDRTWAVLADELQRSGVAEDVTLDPTIEDQEWPPYHIGARHHMMSGDVMVAHQDNAWPRHPEWTWHHMGTTRMHDSPKHGVVDRNCLVHGMSNLYIAGSSVFPTAAANFPTMTITALTLRLSKHIARVVREPVARVEEPSPLVCVAGA